MLFIFAALIKIVKAVRQNFYLLPFDKVEIPQTILQKLRLEIWQLRQTNLQDRQTRRNQQQLQEEKT